MTNARETELGEHNCPILHRPKSRETGKQGVRRGSSDQNCLNSDPNSFAYGNKSGLQGRRRWKSCFGVIAGRKCNRRVPVAALRAFAAYEVRTAQYEVHRLLQCSAFAIAELGI